MKETDNDFSPIVENCRLELALVQYKYVFLHSLEKKSTFVPFRVKKHHSTLDMDTFKVM